MTFQIKVNGSWTDLPAPAKEGIVITREPIWGENTGRSASGKMTGDIVGRKTTIEVTWPPLPGKTVGTKLGVDRIISSIEGAGPFFDIKFDNDIGSSTQQYTVYASNIPRTIYSLAAGLHFTNTGVTVTFVEQ